MFLIKPFTYVKMEKRPATSLIKDKNEFLCYESHDSFGLGHVAAFLLKVTF